MSKQSTEAQIRARIDALVEDLTGLIRQAALEAVQDALMGTRSSAPARASKPAGASRKKKAGRRSSKKLKSLDTETVYAAIKSHPGERTEVIAQSLGTGSKALKDAIDELVATKRIKRKGKARGTSLHLAGGGVRKATSKKTGKKKAGKKKAGKKKASRKKRGRK